MNQNWSRVITLALLALVPACASTELDPENLPDEAVLDFEAVEIAGVTTDHASSGGAAWVDYDDDGDLDLFVTNGYDVSQAEPTPQTNRLYRNDGLGGFEAIDSGPLAEVEGFSSGNTWGDYDNDGDLDLFVTNQQDQDNLLFRNEGGGSFSQVVDALPARDGGHSYAAGWVDFDHDGWLDLFVGNGGMSHTGPNRLYRNTGDGEFVVVIEGAIVTDEAPSCGFAWGDYDNDGDVDLFVANQGFNPANNNNALYRNDGAGAFTPVLESPVVNDHMPSSAAAWVDVDNDLDLDLHLTNLYGLADLLYLNDGTGGLEPATDSPVSLEGGYGFDANWEDYDNDGDIDLVVANWGSSVNLYLNDGHGSFNRVEAGDLTGRIHHAGTIASGDYDADGDVDIYIANWPNGPGPEETNRLYRNRGNDHHWLQVRLTGTTSNRSAIGARVLVTTGEGAEAVTQMREQVSQTGFRGQSSMIAHFGLGTATEVARVEVVWPSGKRSTQAEVAVDRQIEIVEP